MEYSCTDLTAPLNGYADLIYGEKGESGSVVEFSCKREFILSGHNLLTCTINGSWNHDPPECIGIVYVE